jgi:hypothetical protein
MSAIYPIFQYAYYVTHLEEAIHQWHELHGAGPFALARHHKAKHFQYRGTAQEADVSYAFGYLGDLQIQLITQHDDTPSIYREMYQNHQSGFHHAGCLVNDFAAARQRMLNLGFDNACELWADGVNAAYFDTRNVNGGFTEIHGDPVHILTAFATWKRAHENKKAGDSAIMTPGAPYPDGRDPDYLKIDTQSKSTE